jgi:hypothetical protein
MEYHKKDILHVMQLLGHKNIQNTLVYTHLVTFETEDNYVCKMTKRVKESLEIVESGFEYMCDVDGYKSEEKVSLRVCKLGREFKQLFYVHAYFLF